MFITAAIPQNVARPSRAGVARPSAPTVARPMVDEVVLSGAGGDALTELWRDFGINPVAMARRAFVEKSPAAGSPLPGGTKVSAVVMDEMRELLQHAIEQSYSLHSLQHNLQTVASGVGVGVDIESGAPLVNWDSQRPGVLDVRHTGGAPAMHEMVHLVQCIIGGGAAMATAATEDFRREHGREAKDLAELRPFIDRLDDPRKAIAMTAVVKPMETTAYSRFEETAFHVAGFFGRGSKDFSVYQARLKEVTDAFITGYQDAEVPGLPTAIDARIYGGVGHLARTHGETALLMAGAGAAYYGLTRAAMRIHPALALPMACPLGYLLYRSMVSG